MNPKDALAITVLAASLGAIAVAMLLVDLFLRDQTKVKLRLREEIGDGSLDRLKASPLFRDLHAVTDIRPPRWTLFGRWLQGLIDQAGWQMPLSRLAIGAGTAACGAGLATGLVSHSWLLSPPVALLALVMPFILAVDARRRRRQKFCEQLPEAFEFMARSLRAGQSLPIAFQTVGQTFREPVASEFARCYEQQNLGVPVDIALRSLAGRIDIMELRIFVIALIVQHRAGGNLAELLIKLARVMRKRITLKGRVRALTGEGRMQAWVLIALPIVAFVALWFLNPQHTAVLLQHRNLLYAAVAAQAIGAALIWKIVNFEY